MKPEDLCKELQERIEGLNTEFQKHHQTLTDKLNNITKTESAKGIADILSLGLTSTNPMIKHLRAINNTVKELQQMKKDSVQNNEILRSVRSADMGRIAKPLKPHEELTGRINTLLLELDHCRINQQNESQFIPQMRETADQFKENLNEIKHAKEYINKL
ncbi:hypothetical protein PO909_024829, partial [Leuciscus waleckii]